MAITSLGEYVPPTAGFRLDLGPTMLGIHLLLGFFLADLSLMANAAKSKAEEHLDLGNKMLASGQLADALSHYHSAVDADPTNYMSYFRRATTLLALARSKSALKDFDEVVKLKPDFTHARIQRGMVYLRQGLLKDARTDFEWALKGDSSSQDAIDYLATVQEQIPVWAHAEDVCDSDALDAEACNTAASTIIEVSPFAIDPRLWRSNAKINLGDIFGGLGDLKAAIKNDPDNLHTIYRAADIYFQIGEAEDGLIQIRECLKMDQDHKECKTLYTKLKKLVKAINNAKESMQNEQFTDCIKASEQIMKIENKNRKYIFKAKSNMCTCYSKAQDPIHGIKACDEALEIDSRDIDLLCNRADLKLVDEDWDGAVHDFQEALNIDQNFQRARQGVGKAEKLRKQANRKDYYKILGVPRNANKRQIEKAYRKIAVQWHPDKYEGDDKKKAEKMFIDAAHAKEVLTDPEKREQFDQGIDPLDPEQQSGGGGHHGHPFHGFRRGGGGGGGFNPFGDGGHTFTFFT